MKKFSGVVLLLIVLLTSTSLAHETNIYKIDMPTGYHMVNENSYSDANGYNINVSIFEYTDTVFVEDIYNDEALEIARQNIYAIEEYMKNNLKQSVKERYPGTYTDEELDEYASSYKITGIPVLEISTFSKNNYKCIHYIYCMQMGDTFYYANVFQTTDKEAVYTLTLSGPTLAYFNKTEIINAINSFTVKNYVSLDSKIEIIEQDMDMKFKYSTIDYVVFFGIFAIMLVIYLYIIIKMKKIKSNVIFASIFAIMYYLLLQGSLDNLSTSVVRLENNDLLYICTSYMGYFLIPSFLLILLIINVKKNSKSLSEYKEYTSKTDIELDKNILGAYNNKKIKIPYELQEIKEEITEDNIVLQEEKNNEANINIELEKIELLKKYKELLDSGTITEEDFNKKKENLLK